MNNDSSQRILIFGSNGMLGRYILNELSNKTEWLIIPSYRKDFQIGKDSLIPFLTKHHPTIIINCAGVIPQRNKHQNEFVYVNAVFPNLLGEYCHQHSIRFIHITTDCVYSGNKGKYVETDDHDANDIYGLTKSAGEKHYGQIIRTSIIGEEKYNKVSLLEWIINHQQYSNINGFTDHIWNGVTCHQLAIIIYQLIDEQIKWVGVRHIFSPTSVTKFEIIQMINEIYQLKLNINPLKTKKIDKTLSTNYNMPFKISNIKIQLEIQKKLRD